MLINKKTSAGFGSLNYIVIVLCIGHLTIYTKTDQLNWHPLETRTGNTQVKSFNV